MSVLCHTDASLHTVFTQLGGVTSAVDLLKSAVRIHNESLRQQVCYISRSFCEILPQCIEFLSLKVL